MLPLHEVVGDAPGHAPAHVPLPGLLQDGQCLGDAWGMLVVVTCVVGVACAKRARKLAVYMRVLRWFL